jgi:hypothetical protein
MPGPRCTGTSRCLVARASIHALENRGGDRFTAFGNRQISGVCQRDHLGARQPQSCLGRLDGNRQQHPFQNAFQHRSVMDLLALLRGNDPVKPARYNRCWVCPMRRPYCAAAVRMEWKRRAVTLERKKRLPTRATAHAGWSNFLAVQPIMIVGKLRRIHVHLTPTCCRYSAACDRSGILASGRGA